MNVQQQNYTPVSSASAINAKDSDIIYLIKYPKSINITELNDVNLTIRPSSKTSTKTGKRFNVISDIGEKQRMCAVVGKGSNSGVQEFNGVLSFQEEIATEKSIDLEVNLNSLSLPEQAYKPVSQIQGLKVINVPIGSVSTVEQIQARTLNSNSTTQNKRQRIQPDESKSEKEDKETKEKKKKRKKESK